MPDKAQDGVWQLHCPDCPETFTIPEGGASLFDMLALIRHASACGIELDDYERKLVNHT